MAWQVDEEKEEGQADMLAERRQSNAAASPSSAADRANAGDSTKGGLPNGISSAAAAQAHGSPSGLLSVPFRHQMLPGSFAS